MNKKTHEKINEKCEGESEEDTEKPDPKKNATNAREENENGEVCDWKGEKESESGSEEENEKLHEEWSRCGCDERRTNEQDVKNAEHRKSYPMNEKS